MVSVLNLFYNSGKDTFVFVSSVEFVNRDILSSASVSELNCLQTSIHEPKYYCITINSDKTNRDLRDISVSIPVPVYY